jgi:dTDP-glucose 4,6-dehydratase
LQANGPPRHALQAQRAAELFGFTAPTSLANGIRQTVEWYRSNESWWRAIKEGEFRTYYERMYGQRKVLKEVKA